MTVLNPAQRSGGPAQRGLGVGLGARMGLSLRCAAWQVVPLLWAIASLVMGAAAQAAAGGAATEFLPVEQAFRGSAQLQADGRLALRFDIAPGYHLYRERFAIEDVHRPSVWRTEQVPDGRLVHDANLDEDLHHWDGQVTVLLQRTALLPGSAAREQVMTVRYQGCAEAGLCYPPQNVALRLGFDAGGLPVSVQWPAADGSAPAADAPAAAMALAGVGTPGVATASTVRGEVNRETSGDDGSDGTARALRSGHLPTVAGVFMLAGLLLSFTPCVLPMVPILSSIIVGQGQAVSRAKGFSLALAYAMGMAVVYTLFGIAAGLAGEGLAAALQNGWVLGAFGLLLVVLALSMFGAYELQLPTALQGAVTGWSQRLPGGNHLGVLMMGGLSALIVGPCVAAPLAGALVYISQTRDVLLGGLALFSLAMGMSVPLLLVGASAGTLLPRTGRWMAQVKTVFGFALLAVALWLVSPVLPDAATLALAGALGLAASASLVEAFRSPGPLRPWARAAAVLLALVGGAQVLGALSGGDRLLQPLDHLARGASGAALAAVAGSPGAAATRTDAALAFQRIGSSAELDAVLRSAQQPVMLDFYADWCVACKELEHNTFSDPGVRRRMASARLLQADVTANSEAQRALLKRFGLFGPPGVLFFDPAGQEVAAARVIGYLPPAEFLRQAGRAGL